ncbi:hypothetical protein [Sphaerisporangium corydalis]|uniref:ABC transporter substrate-binding protein n=1 Tax=Sphaerisporangium corydalis TaxID=1441875 RepID=A0ABV9EPR1_9ACTN|nr:hypothetical protein [Sphaerisporangium corydalis]
MKLQRFISVLATAATGAVLVLTAAGPASATTAQAPSAKTQSAAPSSVLETPVSGTFTDAAGGTGAFTGLFTPTQFVGDAGKLATVGTLTGTLTDSAGKTLGTVNQQSTVPTTVALATCDILNLDLGPLDLNLLGLQVHLNRVVLDIVASAVPGGLLGNLLCAVAHLLDPFQLTALLNLLNQILGLLR